MRLKIYYLDRDKYQKNTFRIFFLNLLEIKVQLSEKITQKNRIFQIDFSC
jgi:hypothetical protein